MTIHNVTTAAELTAALNAAVGGDRIELATGNYGSPRIRKQYGSEVVIASVTPAAPAVFTGIDFDGAVNITFDWLHCKGSGPGRPFDGVGCANVIWRNCIFEGKRDGAGLGQGVGLGVWSSNNIIVEFCEFLYWKKAHQLISSDDWIIRNCNVHSCAEDGFNVNSAKNGVVENCHFHDFKKAPGAHSDAIQWWNNDPSRPVNGLIVRGNFIDAGLGDTTQSIFGRNGQAEQTPGNLSVYYRDILVENNVIYNGHIHGISVGPTIGLTVRNNTLLRNNFSNGVHNPPTIRQEGGPSQQVVIDKNIAHAAHGTNAFVVQDDNPSGANYYDDVFVNARAMGPTLADLRAVPGGTIEALGVGAAMTRADIPLNVGPGAGTAPPPPQNQAPAADFSVSTTDLVATFTDLSTDPDGTVDAWDWDFGDGATATAQNPQHTYAAGGSYQATLTVTDNDGATATAVQPVTVTEPAPPPPPPGTGPVFQTGPHVFDGTLGAAQIFPHDPAYEVADGTIEVAFTVDGLVARQAIFSKDASGNASGGHFNLYLEQGNLFARIQDAANSYTVLKLAGVVGGQSHHVAVTVGAGGLTLWLDGVVVDVDPYSGGLFPSTEFIVIGANNWASTSGTTNKLREPMTGTVERASLYDRVLSAEEIQSLSSSGALPQPMTLEEQVSTLAARLDAMEARLARLGG